MYIEILPDPKDYVLLRYKGELEAESTSSVCFLSVSEACLLKQ